MLGMYVVAAVGFFAAG